MLEIDEDFCSFHYIIHEIEDERKTRETFNRRSQAPSFSFSRDQPEKQIYFLQQKTSIDLSSLCPDVVEHVLLLLLLPLLLQHLRRHHCLHLVRVVVLTLRDLVRYENGSPWIPKNTSTNKKQDKKDIKMCWLFLGTLTEVTCTSVVDLGNIDPKMASCLWTLEH